MAVPQRVDDGLRRAALRGRARRGPSWPRTRAGPRRPPLQLRVLRDAGGRDRRRDVRPPPAVRRAVPAVPRAGEQGRRLRRRTARPAVRGGSSLSARGPALSGTRSTTTSIRPTGSGVSWIRFVAYEAPDTRLAVLRAP